MGKFSIATFIGAVFLTAAPVGAQSRPAELPEGEGRPLVQGMCTSCHDTNLITRSSGYTRDGWRELISTMIDLSGNPAEETISKYLAAHFPPRPDLKPKLVSGKTSLAFRQWKVPTLGQRARDPVQAPDGSIWWAGMWGNLVGRIKPETGEVWEYSLPEGAKPHSVTPDPEGNIWYTGNSNATIGKLDPRTGRITEYKMPDPAARDPHTAVFDKNGTLWFTLQQSNMVGRLIPATGEIKLMTMPIPKSRPYGIKVASDGALWIACNGANCVVRMDPQTMALRPYSLPDPKTTVRRLDIASDGMIWYVNSSLGRLGRLDPRTGQTKEWPSPSGAKSHPYAIAVVDDIVWYNESGQRPDALVRFDPATERFQSWPIPSGGIYAGIVRHMRPTREGNLLIEQTSTNRIILVTVKSPNGSRQAKRL
ncbi:MAG TPA: cytochrome C [Candidatus Eisenbacteria bacterium]|nr:cytochrome C [Candidatus Eisenbacteria bacterium]